MGYSGVRSNFRRLNPLLFIFGLAMTCVCLFFFHAFSFILHWVFGYAQEIVSGETGGTTPAIRGGSEETVCPGHYARRLALAHLSLPQTVETITNLEVLVNPSTSIYRTVNNTIVLGKFG